MKTTLIIICSVCLSFGFIFKPKPNELTWVTNFKEAVKQAKRENKTLLVNFTGSDWCGWCIRLDREVFKKTEFIEYANKNLVCVKLDFPMRKKLTQAEALQNEELRKKYEVEGFPTILLLDTDENLLMVTGYQAGGPVKYVEHLKEGIDQKN
jgi:protein disulfide-isomerase